MPSVQDANSIPWVEKYRPKSLDEVTAQDHTINIIKRSLGQANLPHMLFYGPPGTGKTSTILALAKDLYGPDLFKSRVLELNASDERGISIVREKVKQFAQLSISKPSDSDLKNYPCPPYKIVILDEADSMTADAQSALRRTMENYSKITRFCLICNYVTRIIDPLASRCSKFRFVPLDETNSLERIKHIAAEEEVNVDDDSLVKLLKCSEGDLRRAITLLQSTSKFNLKVTPEVIDEVSGTIPSDRVDTVVAATKQTHIKPIRAAIKLLVQEGWSATNLLDQLHDRLLRDETLTSSKKDSISDILSEADKRLVDGSSEEVVLLDVVTRISLAA